MRQPHYEVTVHIPAELIGLVKKEKRDDMALLLAVG